MPVLLVGNGLNQVDPSDNYFSTSSIARRFKTILNANTQLLTSMFMNWVNIPDDDLYLICNCSEDINIEELSAKVCDFIVQSNKTHLSTQEFEYFIANNKTRIVYALTAICLEAIFVEGTDLHFANIPSVFVDTIGSYDSVITLNYYELWGPTSCKYIHGAFDVSGIVPNGQPLLFYDKILYDVHPQYASDINRRIINKNPIALTNIRNIIMTPALKEFDKQEVYGKGLFPGNIYPGHDLFPRSTRDIYEDLNGISDLHVFGISPFGDDALLEKIGQISEVTVFVYGIAHPNKARELSEWKKILPNAKLINSTGFIK